MDRAVFVFSNLPPPPPAPPTRPSAQILPVFDRRLGQAVGVNSKTPTERELRSWCSGQQVVFLRPGPYGTDEGGGSLRPLARLACCRCRCVLFLSGWGQVCKSRHAAPAASGPAAAVEGGRHVDFHGVVVDREQLVLSDLGRPYRHAQVGMVLGLAGMWERGRRGGGEACRFSFCLPFVVPLSTWPRIVCSLPLF